MPTFKNCMFIGVDKELLCKEEREIKENESFVDCTFLVDKRGCALLIKEKRRPKINLWENLQKLLLKK